MFKDYLVEHASVGQLQYILPEPYIQLALLDIVGQQ